MSTIKSDNSDLTINASGSTSDIKFQANGVEKASISSAGAFTSTTIDATKLTGNLPAISGASLTSLTSGNLTGALPAISGASLTNLPGGGKVLQVLSTTKTDVFSTTSTSPTAVTGLSVTITPSATSSKILVMVTTYGASSTSTGQWFMRLYRGASAIAGADSGGWNENATFYGSQASYDGAQVSVNHLDSPSSTSAVTYKVYGYQPITGRTFKVNQNGEGNGRSVSTITVMEIGA